MFLSTVYSLYFCLFCCFFGKWRCSYR